MRRTIVLIDGEHHPPVVRAALEAVRARGDDIAGAVFLGGREKLDRALDLGVPIMSAGEPSFAEQRRALEEALDRFSPDAAIDLSDAPIVDDERRFALASVALARGVTYEGAGFHFDAPERPRLCGMPSLAVIGSAKRAGKTAVGALLARTLVERGIRPVVVAMGRGGPAHPTLVRGDLHPPEVEDLLAVVEQGGHAASDYYEDAILGRVATVGARRAGAGLAGAPFVDNVAEAVAIANEVPADIIVLEGSGTAIPPVAADATVTVIREGDSTGRGLGLYRLLLADLVVVTMTSEPTVSSHLSELLSSPHRKPGRVIVRTVFRPTPATPVRGETIFYATTAPENVSEDLVAHLQDIHGANVAGISHQLADRDRLARDLDDAAGTYAVLVTELKAAAVDTAAAKARATGARVVFCDNVPVALPGEPDLPEALADLTALARERFARVDA